MKEYDLNQLLNNYELLNEKIQDFMANKTLKKQNPDEE